VSVPAAGRRAATRLRSRLPCRETPFFKPCPRAMRCGPCRQKKPRCMGGVLNVNARLIPKASTKNDLSQLLHVSVFERFQFNVFDRVRLQRRSAVMRFPGGPLLPPWPALPTSARQRRDRCSRGDCNWRVSKREQYSIPNACISEYLPTSTSPGSCAFQRAIIRTSNPRSSSRSCSRPSAPRRRCCTWRTAARLRGSGSWRRRRPAWCAPHTRPSSPR
jgi:hypothetical protein